MQSTDLKYLLKRAVELCAPDLWAYFRGVRKARVVKAYASDGRYYADVQPLLNDHSDDPDEPVVPKVEIPVIWAGPSRGVACPPLVGSHCDLDYYRGDPDHPRISNFRWHGNKAPAVAVNGFIIQQGPGCSISIEADGSIVHITPAGRKNTIGGAKTETAAAWTITVDGNADISAGGKVSISAPRIDLNGLLTASMGSGGGAGTVLGDLRITGDLDVQGDIRGEKTIIDKEGNTDHHDGH